MLRLNAIYIVLLKQAVSDLANAPCWTNSHIDLLTVIEFDFTGRGQTRRFAKGWIDKLCFGRSPVFLPERRNESQRQRFAICFHWVYCMFIHVPPLAPKQ